MVFFFVIRPQPYRALKESDSADGDENTSPEKPQGPGHADPPTPDSPTGISLLEGIFIGLEVEPQLLTQAKSLEDLRITKEDENQQCTFDYQVWGLVLHKGKSTCFFWGGGC